MIKYFGALILFLIIFFLVPLSQNNLARDVDTCQINIQDTDSLNIDDGPYILIKQDSLIEYIIEKGDLKSRNLDFKMMPTNFPTELSEFKNVSKIAAFSDLHGQYELSIKILKNNHIIDENLKWSYGEGHLVIVGDIFDRGSQVTELLWFFYDLEKQAEKNGGKVHYILGNHEYMVMQNDLRYVNPKYELSAKLINTTYDELYGRQSIIGRWLRSKATILKINDNIFVHGGISDKFIGDKFILKETNQNMRQSLNENKKINKRDSVYGKYYDSFGPIWYRGYFSDDFTETNINEILNKLDSKHIIVGHTSQSEITSLFQKKIIAVDSSIKLGISGEILLIENGNYYRGTMEGDKILLN